MAQRIVNEFKEISLVYSSNGAATLQLYTDMPGGALAARLNSGTGITLASSSSARVELTIPLDTIRGKEFYVKITPGNTTQFELYQGNILFRPIGVYIDGSAPNGGEIWQMQAIAPGV